MSAPTSPVILSPPDPRSTCQARPASFGFPLMKDLFQTNL